MVSIPLCLLLVSSSLFYHLLIHKILFQSALKLLHSPTHLLLCLHSQGKVLPLWNSTLPMSIGAKVITMHLSLLWWHGASGSTTVFSPIVNYLPTSLVGCSSTTKIASLGISFLSLWGMWRSSLAALMAPSLTIPLSQSGRRWLINLLSTWLPLIFHLKVMAKEASSDAFIYPYQLILCFTLLTIIN